MTPERWQQVKTVFQQALERDAGERPVYLAQVCTNDDALRREVEKLLAGHEQAGSFIETAPHEVAADLVTAQTTLAGQQLNHYRILAPLGKGGMGEVYLAQDVKLGRKVALKLLPAEFTANAERLRRFEQEARAASALNHPNIVTIFEIDEVEQLHFIATEFIEGQSLRERLRGARLTQIEALDIAIQIATALTAAHAAGILHRDIKPDNIMLRHDG
ncbi:MAG TPA: serine/threonine-protein kinase, partial [Blastocatellia bacterium]|nr:serine/threonine-protein kinase [Blastocatellia bacterium]